MNYLSFLAFACITVSVIDLNKRRIPNKLLLVFLTIQFFYLGFEHSHFGSMLLVIVVGLVFFSLGWVAAGDIKYAGVLSLSLPITTLYEALLSTAYSGGILVLFYCVKYRISSCGRARDVTLPYGVAISVGFFLTIFGYQLQFQQ